MSATSHTAALTLPQAEKLRTLLGDRGFDFIEKPYTLFAARKGKLQVSVYQKGPKILVQGKETEDFVRFLLEPEILGEARLGYEETLHPDRYAPHFGIDESGKGDYFGPLVIAGVYTDAAIARALAEIGVMDSKRITSPQRIRTLAAKIRDLPGIETAIVSIGPQKYNELHTRLGSINRLLAWGHARAIALLHEKRPDCPRALSDQFAQPQVLERALKGQKVEITLEQRTKAESDPAVAAASILARERFIDWMDQTSAASGVSLPLGASASVIDAARQVIDLHGIASLEKIAKLHFKTTQQVRANDGKTGTESA
ncbi:ribonuclease HIII [Haloferula luteola]|uniref:Ribonuclease n=1 Tax=Haloferula luteola TaxID=595692 RepID=A0A840VDI2_9BACT|nr:ribonuclease HIII [Haloferula luteola]MBB5350901.1 ribonuclease HIII [Haloferula luteola]